jgi:predicted tellurium resistance membrane protein TerC
MDQNDPSDQESAELFKNSETRSLALQRLWLWTITMVILFFVGLAMMTYAFPTMPQGAKVLIFIFWLLCYIFSARKMQIALTEFSLAHVSPPNQDKRSSK